MAPFSNTIRGYWEKIVLSLLIFVGTFLRFFHLDYNSLWLDEACTFKIASFPLSGIWNIAATTDPHPPLFYIIEHFMLVFGQNEFVLRFIPALFGILTIPIFYFIGKEFRDESVGITMAALLTFSPFHIYYSQEARAYTMMLFYFSIALFFLLYSLCTNKKYSWILFGIFSALTFWTHYYSIIFLTLIFMFILFLRIRPDMKCMKEPYRYGISIVIFTLFCLPLTLIIFSLYNQLGSIPPVWGIKRFEFLNRLFITLSAEHFTLMVLFLLLFTSGLFFILKHDKAKGILVMGLFALPIFIGLYLAEVTPMDVRYLILLLPFFFLGISCSIKPLANLLKYKNATSIFLIIFFAIQTPFLALTYHTYYTEYSKEDWRGIANSLRETSSGGDYIFIVPGYTSLPLNFYYDNTTDATFEFGTQNESEISSRIENLKNNKAFFVVTDHIKAADPGGRTLKWIKNNSHIIEKKNGINLYLLN